MSFLSRFSPLSTYSSGARIWKKIIALIFILNYSGSHGTFKCQVSLKQLRHYQYFLSRCFLLSLNSLVIFCKQILKHAYNYADLYFTQNNIYTYIYTNMHMYMIHTPTTHAHAYTKILTYAEIHTCTYIHITPIHKDIVGRKQVYSTDRIMTFYIYLFSFFSLLFRLLRRYL